MIVIAGARSEVILRRYPKGVQLLTDTERLRADSFRFPRDRESFIASHVALRACVADLVDEPIGDIGIEQFCLDCGGSHGRPTALGYPELALSLSHMVGYVAACAAQRGPVGIDVTAAVGDPSEILYSALAEPEIELVRRSPDPYLKFAHFWATKECLVKAGHASLDGLDELDLSADLSRWKELRLRHWVEGGEFVGACAAPAQQVRGTPRPEL